MLLPWKFAEIAAGSGSVSSSDTFDDFVAATSCAPAVAGSMSSATPSTAMVSPRAIDAPPRKSGRYSAPRLRAPVAEKTRDADRSRRAILSAATRLFAERGYDATSLADVGAAAGLSRQTPAYFFGSKDELYAAVLQELFAERERELVPAFAPLHAWAGGDDARPLGKVLGDAVDAYLDFLQAHPEFVSL